jgi:hypothetical protein
MASTGGSTTLDEIDLDDPCARYSALNRAYMLLVAGMHEVKIVFRDGDSLEEVNYTPPSLPRLAMERSKALMECQARTSGRPSRRAIIAG